MKMKLPKDAYGFNPAGFELDVVNGIVEVPHDHIQTALSHGLTPHKEDAPVADEAISKGSKVTFTYEGEDEPVVGVVKTMHTNGTATLTDAAGEDHRIEVSLLALVKE